MKVWILVLLIASVDPQLNGREFASRAECMAAGTEATADHLEAIRNDGTPFVCVLAPSELRNTR